MDISLRPARKRIGQGVRALLAFATPVDDEAARTVLVTPALFGLFKRMRRSEQLMVRSQFGAPCELGDESLVELVAIVLIEVVLSHRNQVVLSVNIELHVGRDVL